MSEPEIESTVDQQSAEADQTPQPPISKKRIRRSLMALLGGVAAIGLLQWIAPVWDHQYANMLSVIVGAVAVIYVIAQAHLGSVAAGKVWRVPVVVLLALIGFFIFYQPDGFSGEMLPLFRYRFAPRPEFKKVTEATVPSMPADAESATAVALADFPQFLGSDRIGVISERKFSRPTKPADVEVLWDQGIGQGWASFAVSGDRAVTLEQRDDEECVTCYRLADGELVWIHSYEAYHYHTLGGAGPRSTPTIADGKVYAQGSTGRLWCLELETGEVIWDVDLLEQGGWSQEESDVAIAWGRAGSPLISDGMCVVPLGTPVDPEQPDKPAQRSLIALDAETGVERWRAGQDQISYASPMVMTLAGTRQIVSVNEKTITGHTIGSGDTLWEFDWPGMSNSNATCTSAMPAGKDRFVIGKGYGGGSALLEVTKRDDGNFSADVVWDSTRVLKTKFTHACVVGDIAYALSDGSLQAVSLENGDRLWMQPRSARAGQGQMLVAGDVIVVQNEAGGVVFVDANPQAYEELLRLDALSAKTWNIPALAGRHLLVRNDRQVICYLLPE